MTAALRSAAADHGATLTPHNAAIERARSAVARVDAFVSSMKGSGRLRAFNESYRAARVAAAARGESFITYNVAEALAR
jgi:hypothetical protein